MADQASKEFAIKLTLESIRVDIEHAKLIVADYKDSETIIIRNIDKELSTFQECEMKTRTLLQNKYSRPLQDPINLTLKELRNLIKFYT